MCVCLSASSIRCAPAHWLTGLSAFCPTTRQPLFYATATLCSSYMHSHFNHIYMYILSQLARPTSAPAHWLTGLSALCPTTHQLLLYATATLCSSYMHSHFNHIYMHCQLCVVPNNVHSIEFTTVELRSSCRNISWMINGNRMYPSSISSLIAKGLNTYTCI